MADFSQENSEIGLITRRIEALSDGVFAIAMTLLALNLHIPAMTKDLTQAGLHVLLIGQADKFLNYLLSFILLAVFWIIHHQQFHLIKQTNRTHLWINIFILMFIALVPFSTSLADHYPNDWVSELFFGSNLFILGMLFSWNWHYATQKHRLVDSNLDARRIALGKRRGMVTPVVSFLAIILSLIKPQLSSYIYILIPILLQLPPFRS